MTTTTIPRLELVEELIAANPYDVRGSRRWSNWVAGAYSAIAGESPPLDTDPTAMHQGYAWGKEYSGGETL